MLEIAAIAGDFQIATGEYRDCHRRVPTLSGLPPESADIARIATGECRDY
ncbi:MAG: hypothetical protein PUF45_07070 [Lachnospiraceae bacterium]|nr:hypothetical protein [Lachnospiraceae bacterium]